VKKFHFNLERVLRVRRLQETLRLADLKRAERALASQKQKLTLFETERDAQSNAMRVNRLDEFTVQQCQIDWRYLQRIERIVDIQESVVVQHTQHETTARKRFQAARQKSRGLEKLGEKKFAEWNRDLLELEQKIADDRPRKSKKSSS